MPASISTKGTARLNILVGQTIRYQHVYCGRALNLIQALDVKFIIARFVHLHPFPLLLAPRFKIFI